MFQKLKQEMVFTKHFFYFSTVYGKFFLFLWEKFPVMTQVICGEGEGLM